LSKSHLPSSFAAPLLMLSRSHVSSEVKRVFFCVLFWAYYSVGLSFVTDPFCANFCIWFKTGVQLHLLRMDIQLFHYHYGRDFSHWIVLAHFSKINWSAWHQ
jgi:hypothetical protein